MAHRVLDQAHDGHGRTLQLFASGRNIEPELQPVGHAHLHQHQVGTRHVQFLLQSGGRFVQARYRRPQIRHQMREHRRRVV